MSRIILVFLSIPYIIVTLSEDIDCDNYWPQLNETCDENYYTPTIAIQTLSGYATGLRTYSKISLSIKANHDVMITPHCISMDIDINPSIIMYLAHEWLSNNVEWPHSHEIGDIITFTDEDASESITFSKQACILSPNSTNALILLFNTHFNGYSIETHDIETCTNAQDADSLNIYDTFYKDPELNEEEECLSPVISHTTKWNLYILDEDEIDIEETRVIYEYINHMNSSNDSLIMSLIMVIIVLNICCCALLWFFNQKQFYQNVKEIRQNIDHLYADKKGVNNNNDLFLDDDSHDTDTEEDDESLHIDAEVINISINCDDIHAEEASKHNVSMMATADLSETATTDTSLPAPSPSDPNIEASNIAMYSNTIDDSYYDQNQRAEMQADCNKNNIVWVNQSYFDSNSRDDNYNLFRLRLQNSNNTGSNTSYYSDDTQSPKMVHKAMKKANDKLNKLRIVLPPKTVANKIQINPWNSNTNTSGHTSDTTLSAMTLSADDMCDFLSPTRSQNTMEAIHENEETPIAKVNNNNNNNNNGVNKNKSSDSLFSVASSIRLPAYHPNKIKVLHDNQHIPYNKTFIIAVTPPINDEQHLKKKRGKVLITKENSYVAALPQTNHMHLYHTNMNR